MEKYPSAHSIARLHRRQDRSDSTRWKLPGNILLVKSKIEIHNGGTGLFIEVVKIYINSLVSGSVHIKLTLMI